jgi:D-sedoheptulose 7-phosphate isomerase
MIEALKQARATLDAFLNDDAGVRAASRAGDALASVLSSGGKVLLCGNGGSACDAAHFAEELTGRFRLDRRPLPALACVEPGHLTCTANDYGFERVFSRWVEALGRTPDALVLLSTSGDSPNLLAAAEAGRAAGLTRIALLGKGGGKLRGACEHEVIVPGRTADRVQEVHKIILHGWVEHIERRLGLA